MFDIQSGGGKPLEYKTLLEPGKVSIIGLSDPGMSELNNIVIADLLRGVQDAQDDAYQACDLAKKNNPELVAIDPTPAELRLID